MNKIVKLCGISMLLFGLGACSKNVDKDTTESTETETTSVKKESVKKEKETKNNTIWNAQKESELKAFIDSWSKQMNQEYKFYDSTDELKWNNLIISKDKLEKNKTIEFNQNKQEIDVFSSEDKKGVMNIVAIASDEEDSNPDNHHVYMFSLLDNKPLVLIVSEKSTSSEIIVSETKNEQLKQGFKDIVESSGDTNKVTKDNNFDKLSDDIKAILLTEVVDERLETRFYELNQPDTMFLSYYMDNGYIYVHLTSGRGTGHPIYLLKDEGDVIQPLQTVSRVSYDEYKEYPPKTGDINKEMLYKKHQENKDKYDSAVVNFKLTSEIGEKNAFEDMIKAIGTTNKANNPTKVSSNSKPSAEEIFGYYRDYILDDAGMFSPDLKKRVTMKGVDDQGFPIIAHMVHGSEINISMDGNIIKYSVYSIGGVYDDGTPEKSHLFDAFYNSQTGEHGVY